MTEIADLIFDNNSTLFKVLDNLDVPTLAGEVSEISDSLNASMEQVRQLAIIVDDNQVANNTKFVDVNTRVDTIADVLDDVEENALEALTKVTNLETYTRENVERLDTNLGSVRTKVTSLEERADQTDLQFTSLYNTVGQIDDSVIANEAAIRAVKLDVLRLRVDVDTNTTNIVQLNQLFNAMKTRVDAIEAIFASVPLSLTDIYYSTGYVLPGVIYRVVNQSASNYTQKSLQIDNPTPYRSIRMGGIYSGKIDGVNHDYIQFTDNVTPTTGASFQIQFGMVPVGGPINWRYRTVSGQPIVAGVIRLTKQYIK